MKKGDKINHATTINSDDKYNVINNHRLWFNLGDKRNN